MFINHHGQRKAKGVGDGKPATEEVKRKLEAKWIGIARAAQ